MEKRFKQFLIGAIIVSLVTVAGYLIAPIEVRYLNSLTDNTILIGLTYAIGALLFGIMSIFLGRMSDRVGRNRFLLLGLGLGILYPLLYASTYNVFQYMGVKFVWAFSSVACGPVFMAYLQDLLQGMKKKGQYIGTMYSIQAIGGSVAAFVGGWLSNLYGLKAPYFAMAIMFTIVTVIALFQVDKSPKKKISSDKRDLLFGFKYIFKKPVLVFYFIKNTAFGLNWGIKGMLWPLIIFGMTSSDVMTGSIFATMGLVAFLVLPFAGKIVDTRGVYSVGFASTIFLLISGIVLVFTSSVYVFWIAAAVFAIGEAIYGPMQGVLLTDNVESKYRGEVLGVDAVVDQVYGMISPFIAGLLLVIWTAQQVLGVYVALFFVSLVASAVLYKTKLT